jgi:hypothetical protein
MYELGVPPISGNLHIPILSPLHSGNLKVSYSKWPVIVDFTMKNGDFP